MKQYVVTTVSNVFVQYNELIGQRFFLYVKTALSIHTHLYGISVPHFAAERNGYCISYSFRLADVNVPQYWLS